MPHRAIQLGRHTGRRSGRSILHRTCWSTGWRAWVQRVPDRSLQDLLERGFSERASAAPTGRAVWARTCKRAQKQEGAGVGEREVGDADLRRRVLVLDGRVVVPEGRERPVQGFPPAFQ